MNILNEQRRIVNLDQARQIFERDVLASHAECALVESATREYARCFVFFYQSKKFVETGDFSEMLVGHGPVFIGREDGRVFETGSAFSLDHYLKAFEACGDPLAKPTEKVKIVAWNPGANKARATLLVKERSGMGLAQAKAVVENALSNEGSVFNARTVEQAEQVVTALKEYGFYSVQLWSNQC